MTGTLNKYMDNVRHGVYDKTENGRCVGCGECCSNFLPLSAGEIKKIKRYIARHGIKECRHTIPLASEVMDLICPFLDAGKENDKCRIYSVRPEICRSFICSDILGKCTPELLKGMRFPVDMRETFFGEGTGR